MSGRNIIFRFKSKTPLIPLLLLACVIFLLYWSSLPASFIYDDIVNIVNNEFIKIETLNWGELQEAVNSGGKNLLGRPISMLSFAINYYFSGLDPYYYRMVNVVLHIITAFSLYYFAVLLLRNFSAAKLNNQSIRICAFVATSLWAVSPINFTPVVFIVQRMTEISTLAMVWALIFYIKSREYTLQERQVGKSLIFILLSVFASIISVFSKEIGILIIPHILLLELFVFRTKGAGIIGERTLKVIGLSFLLIPVAYGCYKIAGMPNYFDVVFQNRAFSVGERFLTESRVIFFYLKLIFAPLLSDFGLHHDYFKLSTSLISPISTLFSLIGIISILMTCLFYRNKIPIVVYAILFFFTGHLLESTIFPLDLVYEHRNYLASFGLFFLLSYLLVSQKSKKIALFVSFYLAMFFLLSAFTTYQRAQLWSNELQRLSFSYNAHPDSPRVNNELGALYSRMSLVDSQYKTRLYESALMHQGNYTQLKPEGTEGLVQLIILNSHHKKIIPTEWLNEISRRVSSSNSQISLVYVIDSLPKCLEIEAGCGISVTEIETLITLALKNDNLNGKLLADARMAAAKFYQKYRNNNGRAIELLSKNVAQFYYNPQYLLYRARIHSVNGNIKAMELDIEKLQSRFGYGRYVREIKQMRLFSKEKNQS